MDLSAGGRSGVHPFILYVQSLTCLSNSGLPYGSRLSTEPFSQLPVDRSLFVLFAWPGWQAIRWPTWALSVAG